MNKPTQKTKQAWYDMRIRCNSRKYHSYHRYGGRGITICERWKSSFDNFFSDMGNAPEYLSLDRIDNDGNYEPSNCRWATHTQQIQNSSTVKIKQLSKYAIIRMFHDYKYSVFKLSQIFDVSIKNIENVLNITEAKEKIIIKVYKYYKGNVYSIDAYSSGKTYRPVNDLVDMPEYYEAFGYKKWLRKEICSLSKEEAILKEENIIEYKIKKYKKLYLECESELYVLSKANLKQTKTFND